MKARSVLAGVALAALMAAARGRADASPAATPAPSAASQQRDVSLEEYRGHLQALAAIVDACAKARDAKTCDPALVGMDDRLPFPAPSQPGASAGGESGRRLVSYAWLRALLAQVRNQDKAAAERAAKQAGRAAEKSNVNTEAKPAEGSARKPDAKTAPGAKGSLAEEIARDQARATARLLKDARTRLDRDLAQIDAPPAALPAHTRERVTMNQVLAEPSFRNLEEPPAQDSLLDRIGRWLWRWIGRAIERILASISGVVSRSAWLGRLLLWGLILGVCVGLVWGLLQMERGWRVRLVPEGAFPGAGAASARGWQLWLEDARQAAAAGQWREAIHFLYWASISRLESRRLWPADRARTPREYLALVAPEDPRKAGLATLTGSFERIWYGGRAAEESDYRDAEQLAAALIAASGARGGAAR